MKAASVSKAAAWPDMRRMLAANQAAAASLSADVGGIFTYLWPRGQRGPADEEKELFIDAESCSFSLQRKIQR